MLRAMLVLPTPGGPTKHKIGPLQALGQRPAREVLDDALFRLLQAVMILVQDLLGFRDVERSSVLSDQGRVKIQST